ncbi:hypothetical protein Tco_0621966 [Tanacetum coccineum]
MSRVGNIGSSKDMKSSRSPNRLARFGARDTNLEENADSSFWIRKKAIKKTKHVKSILENLKLDCLKERVLYVYVQRNWLHGILLFLLEYKEGSTRPDVESAHASINNELNRPPNGDETSDDKFLKCEVMNSAQDIPVDSNKTFSGQNVSKWWLSLGCHGGGLSYEFGQVMGYSMEGRVKDFRKQSRKNKEKIKVLDECPIY